MPEGTSAETGYENKIDLLPLFHAASRQLRRSWWAGLLAVAICAALGFSYARYAYSPKYEAKASLWCGRTARR